MLELFIVTKGILENFNTEKIEDSIDKHKNLKNAIIIEKNSYDIATYHKNSNTCIIQDTRHSCTIIMLTKEYLQRDDIEFHSA